MLCGDFHNVKSSMCTQVKTYYFEYCLEDLFIVGDLRPQKGQGDKNNDHSSIVRCLGIY